jgi:hypothetical protein
VLAVPSLLSKCLTFYTTYANNMESHTVALNMSCPCTEMSAWWWLLVFETCNKLHIIDYIVVSWLSDILVSHWRDAFPVSFSVFAPALLHLSHMRVWTICHSSCNNSWCNCRIFSTRFLEENHLSRRANFGHYFYKRIPEPSYLDTRQITA